jgi:hypothetical protein
MIGRDDREPWMTQPGLRAARLALALPGLVAGLVDERRKVAELRGELAEIPGKAPEARSIRTR